MPIGGGAIYGKDYAPIDRRAGRMAREIALERVKAGEKEALVTVAFAPGVGEALEVVGGGLQSVGSAIFDLRF